MTALTIGYGDFFPTTALGKVIVIVHTCSTAVYFGAMISALTVKILYPRDTVCFSAKLLYVPNAGLWGIRLINTHRERLVNPEIRVQMTEHCIGNVIASTYRAGTFDDMPYLGRHDFTLFFSDSIVIEPAKTVLVGTESPGSFRRMEVEPARTLSSLLKKPIPQISGY